jgi:glycosyltransferase involved in cell wall biosynthesis
MSAASPSHPRVRVDGKFLRLGEKKFHIKGVAYGPFAARDDGECFPTPEQTARDLAQIVELGANVIRVYTAPARWLLDLAAEHGLRLLLDIPWPKNHCFLDSERTREQAREAVRGVVRACAGHPAILAYSVVNEIPPDIVRWSGPNKVTDFIEELIDIAKEADPDCLCTFANYPPTEFLRPHNVDFFCFNVYLHHRRPFENYLARLQMQADTKPLILGEFGADSKREGEDEKCEMLTWQIEAGFRSGLAGLVLFAYTDDWWVGGHRVDDWFMGLTTHDRKRKDSFFAVQKAFRIAPYFPLSHYPKVSVVVASYNGARTLKVCLDSLVHLNYPDYEVILVDDGSTDNSPEIASLYTKGTGSGSNRDASEWTPSPPSEGGEGRGEEGRPRTELPLTPALSPLVPRGEREKSAAGLRASRQAVRYLRQTNHGLSVARNTGINAAEGEIVAFTDSDCRADEDWLYYLVGDLLTSRFTGIGGHNFLPPEDSPAAAAVLVSPGGPAHVMLNDRLAEHIPGCNMAFYKWALDEIGGFDPIFTKAGDDVDVCWRLQQRGYRIGFNPAGFVWHYRRSTVKAYLKQQRGYGEAEAMLVRKHPEYFNSVGNSIWRGQIYTASKFGLVVGRSIIYHGVFATGFFQTLYSAPPAWTLMLCTSMEYHVMLTLPLLVLSVPFPFLLPVALTSPLISALVCVAAAWQAELPRNKKKIWSRPLVALLYFLQPIARGWARYHGRLGLQQTPPAASERLEALKQKDAGQSLDHLYYWGDGQIDRIDWVNGIVLRLDQQGWPSKTDTGWSEHDVELFGNRWSRLQLTTATESYGGGKRLFRVRLRAYWSLLGKLAFWSASGFELLVIGIVRHDLPWFWMLLLTMPLFGWFIEQEKRTQQRLIAAFLDDVAKQRGLTKLKFNAAQDKFEPA